MDLTGKILDIGIDYRTKKARVTLELDQRCMEGLEEMRMFEKLKIKIVRFFKHRSLDANKYFWLLCGKLADKLGQSKEDIYRHMIREIGDNYEILPIRKDAAETFIRNWGNGRVGWICERLGDSKIPGYENIMAYYGSSVYDSRQMSRLIDLVVQDCKDQGIETETPEEIARMKEDWRRADEKHSAKG